MAAMAAMLDILPGSHSFLKQYHIRKLSGKFGAFPQNSTFFYTILLYYNKSPRVTYVGSADKDVFTAFTDSYYRFKVKT